MEADTGQMQESSEEMEITLFIMHHLILLYLQLNLFCYLQVCKTVLRSRVLKVLFIGVHLPSEVIITLSGCVRASLS